MYFIEMLEKCYMSKKTIIISISYPFFIFGILGLWMFYQTETNHPCTLCTKKNDTRGLITLCFPVFGTKLWLLIGWSGHVIIVILRHFWPHVRSNDLGYAWNMYGLTPGLWNRLYLAHLLWIMTFAVHMNGNTDSINEIDPKHFK